ncbi:MAG: Gfo/Idh/MocA family protein [Isosphaeraceae bacterium]
MQTRTNRRGFVQTTLAVSTLPGLVGRAAARAGADSQIKLGVIGNGGRGSWIAGLFRKHGGYEMYAVADYFPEVVDKCGEALGVPRQRRFSTLSGYKRLIESGVEAVALEVPPYFLPEHAAAAAAAGLHVYMAKPVAVDVPGCLQIEAAARLAALKHRCFFVDYQIPTDPTNIDVHKAVKDGKIGPLAQVATFGIGGGFADPPKTANLESRLRGLVWVNDVAIGGDYVVNYDIHAVDAALWVIGKRPVAAAGGSRICRRNAHGDGRDVCSVVFEYEGGLVHNHFGQALANQVPGELSCRLHGLTGNATINYWGQARVTGPGVKKTGEVVNLYEAGAVRNIATFHRNIVEERYGNETVPRSVDGALATILAREAAARRTRLTMDELIKENKRLELDLRGLKS